jgi:hypothetical protein
MSIKVVGKFQCFVEYTGQLILVLKFNDIKGLRGSLKPARGLRLCS